MGHVVIFMLGMGATVALKVTGAGALLRPVLKTVVKSGIVLGRQVQQFASEVSEDLQDVAAEANAEIDKATPRPKATKSKA
jgi:hypothetical protein